LCARCWIIPRLHHCIRRPAAQWLRRASIPRSSTPWATARPARASSAAARRSRSMVPSPPQNEDDQRSIGELRTAPPASARTGISHARFDGGSRGDARLVSDGGGKPNAETPNPSRDGCRPPVRDTGDPRRPLRRTPAERQPDGGWLWPGHIAAVRGVSASKGTRSTLDRRHPIRHDPRRNRAIATRVGALHGHRLPGES
jgi:hypothetical protein